jgi:hypothetical protein
LPRARTFFLLIAAGLAIASSRVRASFHEWKITEVYSDASGTNQFIEMFDPAPGENFINTFGAFIGSNSNSYSFPSDLAGDTTNTHLLIATPGFAGLPGGVIPDFTIPAHFFSPAGDTINYDFLNSLTFSAGQLPTNGVNSLNRAYADPSIGASAVNSPTNFNGDVGSVSTPEPAGVALAGIGCGFASLRRRKRRAAGR